MTQTHWGVRAASRNAQAVNTNGNDNNATDSAAPMNVGKSITRRRYWVVFMEWSNHS